MDPSGFFRWHSLKTRVTLFTLAIFLASIWSLAIYASRMLRDDMEQLLGDQQLSTVSIVAADIDRELNERMTGLEAVAAAISPAMRGNTAALQTFVEQLPILRQLFNAGVVVVGRDGIVVADVPRSAGRIGIDLSQIPTIAAALKEGAANIGGPRLGVTRRGPVFGITVPLQDGQGRVIGALNGVTDLAQPNFLEKITTIPYGKTGGYVLLVPKDRLIITATDKSRIMQPLPAPGINPPLDRFLAGYEGSAVYTNPLGVEVLGSARGIPAAGWLLGLTLPTAEAFAPIKAMQQRMLLAAIVLTVLAGSLTGWMLRRELASLLAAADSLATMADADQPMRPLPVGGQTEVAQLLRGFNRLLDSLAHREFALRASEDKLKLLLAASPVTLYTCAATPPFGATYISENIERIMGYRPEQFTAQADFWLDKIHPEDRPRVLEGLPRLFERGEHQHEYRFRMSDGGYRWMHDELRLIRDQSGEVVNIVGYWADVTAQRDAEQRRLAEAREQRDTLVREVHHRIKNNLQSVAGLLQRELGQFIELDPRLETAISQVHAIAAVHGLQSAHPDEAIRLDESVGGICKAVSDLSRRPLRFGVEREQAGAEPVRIENKEAVSISLIANELILNAVKHSPADGPAPTVTLGESRGEARLTIRNALMMPPCFNIDSGEDLGTGLRLVRSLLPDAGARLSYAQDRENFMLTRLELTAPVVAPMAAPKDSPP